MTGTTPTIPPTTTIPTTEVDAVEPAAAAADEQPVVRTPHRYIVVEGPIGVGKTSLVRRLGRSFGSELVLEQDGENPFLERFYRDPKSVAFQTQLHFLFQRARQLADLRQADLFERVRVADYMLDKDRLFARLTLDDAEFALYEQVYAKLAVDAPAPDLIIYLQAPVDVLLQRIARRGIAYEQQIERRYLERLNEAYARYFLEFDAAPLLIVNAADIDPIGNEADYQGLLAEVIRPRKGRHYFNPLKSLL
jgi:deoxyguanosine kinase